mmetsp:Transcript_6104/g.12408  ORF Transcript_6104/g.12408 Transcript_6104/m.12408 type:complete len:373 (-) Transcript_6104:436-1554(-)
MYWLISLPVEHSSHEEEETARGRTWREFKRQAEEQQDLCMSYRFAIPDLRVGTLDSLLTLSDDLVKSCAVAEQTLAKVSRQITEINPDQSPDALLVDGVPVDRYLTAFQWDEAKHPSRRPLKETIENISAGVAILDEDLKVRVNEFNVMKSNRSALSRKDKGSLAVRDLRGVLSADKYVESENLVTLLAVVQRHSKRDWLAMYESLAQYVVPRSSEMVMEDAEYSLMTVVLFKRTMDAFKAAASEKGFMIREYSHMPEGEAPLEEQKSRLEEEFNTKKAELLDWCNTAYSEALGLMVHMVAVRLFVESILRYGLPPCFMAAAVKPHGKQVRKLRMLLADNFGRSQVHWKDNEDTPPGTEEAYPYVSFTLPVE